jgi:uncharacterized membrane protein
MPSSPQGDRRRTIRAIMRWSLAAFYVAAGLAHLKAPDELLAITPSWVPFAPQVIFATGVCELAGAVALVTKPLRWWAGVALAAYAVCVWPANIKHAIDGVELSYIANSWLYHGPRLAFQPVLIWWALYCAEVIDWPWRRAR